MDSQRVEKSFGRIFCQLSQLVNLCATFEVIRSSNQGSQCPTGEIYHTGH